MEKKDVFTANPSAGDESARRRAALLRKYVMPHRNLIYSICIKYTFNREDVEDNYMEALTNFFKYMDSYDPARPVKTWIYAVTKRLIADLNSRNRSRTPPDDNVDIGELRSTLLSDDEPSENCMGMDNYREFYNDDILWALDRLKPIYREAFLLQQAGYKIGEIMEITYRNGTLQTRNIETVKSRLFLAKSQLRNLLTRDGERRVEK
ncbi:RNA polymerase sigma factor [Parabacteroides merdae]|nr:RNA polymerase sigma factor [Parabacteroides merdae]